MRSQLARYQPESATSDGQLRIMAARLWHDRGTALIRPEEITDDYQRQAVINAAERLYGRRQQIRG